MGMVTMRWSDYVLARDTADSEEAWRAAGGDGAGSVLLSGCGFDPRTLEAPTHVAAALPNISLVLGLESPAVGLHQDADSLGADNRAGLTALFGDRFKVVKPPEAQDPGSVGTLHVRQLVEEYDVLNFSHVMIDLSGLPSAISFPLIALFLDASDSGEFAGELQVVVTESPEVDRRIVPVGLDAPATLMGFGRLDESDLKPRVWIPMIGEESTEELRLLRDFIAPNEVCPVLPFPSRLPRRSADLLVEHRTLLFDELTFEPGNVIYAAESNPFDLYRQITSIAERYQRALRSMGGATVVISEHTSKLLSLAAVLVGYESKIAIAHVRPTGYRLLEGPYGPTASQESLTYTAWLTGSPYRTDP